MKKKWAEMTRQDKLLAIRQCIEGGYGWSNGSECDLLEGLRQGYENDPDWFLFSAEDSDWPEILKIYAGLLSGLLGLETTYERDAAYTCIMANHLSLIPFCGEGIMTETREHVSNMMLDFLNDIVSDIEDSIWNNSTQEERIRLARPHCKSLYEEYKNKVSKETWKYFTEVFLVRENWHTYAKILDTMI